ncbi:MAG: hypothetical protein ACE5K3_07070 [bacterium]
MRKLLYVPIIHTEADLGSVAAAIDKRSSQMCGKEHWNQHKKAVSGFWDSIANYFDLLDASNLKIYQDGLMIDGEIGKKIVEEGAKKGSKNYKIILKLVGRGAEIRKTEDIHLLKKEYDTLIKLSQTKSPIEKTLAYIGHKLRKDPLMKKRDKFIAKRINETLQDGEAGVLFIGVYHNVLPQVSRDIIVYELKEKSKVKTYFDELVWGKDEKRFKELAEYLASPVKDPGF